MLLLISERKIFKMNHQTSLQMTLHLKRTADIFVKSKIKNFPPVSSAGRLLLMRKILIERRNCPPHKCHGLRKSASPTLRLCCFSISPK